MIDRAMPEDLARDCAGQMPASPRPLHDDLPAFERELTALIAAVAATHPRYTFDPDGRPGAIAAIRRALPAMEAELLDAVLEDVACELAANREAFYRVLQAVRGSA
jgi:hypothetical protein